MDASNIVQGPLEGPNETLHELCNGRAGVVNADKPAPLFIDNTGDPRVFQLKLLQGRLDAGIQAGQHSIPRRVDPDIPGTFGNDLAGGRLHQLESNGIVARTAEAKRPINAADVESGQGKSIQ